MKITPISKKILPLKALFLDVDGVLTDGGIYINAKGEETKRFNTQDGAGIKRIQAAGVIVAIISGRNSESVNHRMRELGVQHVHQGVAHKLKVYQKLKQQLKLVDSEIAYVGDDLADLELIKIAGLSIAPHNAVTEIKRHADWVTDRNGGYGAVREICDFILYILNTNSVVTH